MRKLKINRKNLKRFGMTGNDVKNGYLSSRFKKDLHNGVSGIIHSSLSNVDKATMEALIILTHNNTKPIKMNRKTKKKIVEIDKALLAGVYRAKERG